jgi:Rrf2 family protein
MLTKKAKYALKAMGRLALSPGSPLTVGELAEADAIPHKFLEAILRELKQHALLTAKKGPGGGFLLSRRPEAISVAVILRVVDGPIAPVPCLSRTAYRKCDECRAESSCAIRLVLREAHEATLRVLESTTLADLAKKSRDPAGEEPVLRYAI